MSTSSWCSTAGWHVARDLRVPQSITLVFLPAYSPELNPVERVWLYLRERFLSLRLLPSPEAVVDACCDAEDKPLFRINPFTFGADKNIPEGETDQPLPARHGCRPDRDELDAGLSALLVRRGELP